MGTQRIQELIVGLAGEVFQNERPPALLEKLDLFIEQINRETVTLFPDEIDVLREVCRLIDDEQDANIAWKKVGNVELTGVYEQPRELDQLLLSVSHNILNSTIAYINLDTGEAASGVVIEIDNRILLATTAHSIPARPRGKLSFVGDHSTKIDENIPPILSSAKDPDYEHRDVAFVELERGFVEDNFGKSAIPLSRIYPCRTGQENWWTCIGGYPTEEIRNIDDSSRQVRTKLFTLQCWGNKILTPDNWQVLEERHRLPNEQLDVFIAYPRSDDFTALGPLRHQASDQLSEPFGMSGGGYWQPQVSLKRELFAPDYYSLIAIQSHWWGKGRYLQGTQIIHWLRLLWQSQPELRDLLASSFPGHDLAGDQQDA